MKTISLTQGRLAIVDDEDYETIVSFKWHARKNYNIWYALRTLNGQNPGKEFMHRRIIRAAYGQMVDHKNGNGLDNRRENLRLTDNSGNQANRGYLRLPSGFRGLTWHRGLEMWQAAIKVRGRSIYLGVFDDRIAAAKAYDAAALKYFGEFARPNFQASGLA